MGRLDKVEDLDANEVLSVLSELTPTAGGVDCLPPKEDVSFVDEDENGLLEGEPDEEMCEPPWSEPVDLFAGETGDDQ